MPNSGNNNGTAFSISNEPLGLSGASIVSQARHNTISAIRLEPAPSLNARSPPPPQPSPSRGEGATGTLHRGFDLFLS